MKVLWFVNIPMPAYVRHTGGAGTNLGGWMVSLLGVLREKIPNLRIAIAFAGEHSDTVELDGVLYCCLCSRYIRRDAERFVHEFRPDVIHLHGSDGLALHLPDAIYQAAPSVLSIQGVLSGYWPHYLGGVTKQEFERGRNRLRELLGLRRMTEEADFWRTRRSTDEKSVFCKVSACLGRTGWDRAWTKALAPQAMYYHVGEVMRPQFYGKPRIMQAVRSHTIYCSAALSYPLKGGHWLLRAVAMLKKKYPDVQLRIANAARIFDDTSLKKKMGKNEYYRYLCTLIEDLGIREQVVALPSLTAEQVAHELMSAEVFCLPSMIENSPNSLGEAMLMGTPAVSTYVGGTPSILRNEEEGLLVPSGDCAMLADAIDRLFADKTLAARYANAARKTAMLRYDPAKVAHELMVAYEGVCRK